MQRFNHCGTRGQRLQLCSEYEMMSIAADLTKFNLVFVYSSDVSRDVWRHHSYVIAASDIKWIEVIDS